MLQNLFGSTSALLVLAAIAACGGEGAGADDAFIADAATTDGGTSTPGKDAAARDGAAPSGPMAPGWNAPFALDPTALGLDLSATWNFTHTEAQGPGPIVGAGLYENASNPSAPVSGPAVGRVTFTTGDSAEGATWQLIPHAGARKERVYFRSMFALSSTYAATPGRETFFAMAQQKANGGTLGQSTLDIWAETRPMSAAEALTVPLRFAVGVLTPNGPAYRQTSGPALTRGTWHQIEAYFVSNTLGSEDGSARVWLDGVLVIDEANIAWADVDAHWWEIAWLNRRDRSDFPLPDGGQHVDHDHLEIYWSATRE